MARPKEVLIVGGGIGGLSLAIALADRGIRSEIVEIKTNWTVYGVGIIQQANVVRAMANLGLVDKFLEASFSFDYVSMHGLDGSLMAKMPSLRLAGEQYPANLGITRLRLHDVLSSEAQARGATVRLSTTVESLTQTGDKAHVRLTDGREKDYDLVVGADGLYSGVRALVFPEAPKPHFTGQAVWRHNFKRIPEVDHLHAVRGATFSVGLVPLSQDLMYMYVTSEEPGNPFMPADQLHTLMRERIKDVGGIVGTVREQITDPSKVVYRPLEAVLVPSPWYRGRVVLLGDAAHATTPHVGQGAGMAIEDAVVLAEEMDTDRPVEEQLHAYMERRFERCKHVVENSLLIGELEMHPASFPGINCNARHMEIVKEMIEFTAKPI